MGFSNYNYMGKEYWAWKDFLNQYSYTIPNSESFRNNISSLVEELDEIYGGVNYTFNSSHTYSNIDEEINVAFIHFLGINKTVRIQMQSEEAYLIYYAGKSIKVSIEDLSCEIIKLFI